jgi:hypothetical protein
MRLNVPRISKTLGAFLTDNPSGAVNFAGMSLMFPRATYEGLGDTLLAQGTAGFTLTSSLLGGASHKFVIDSVSRDVYVVTTQAGVSDKTTYIFANNERVYDGIKPVEEGVVQNTPDQAVLGMIDGDLYMDLNSFGTATITAVTGKSLIDNLYNIGLQNTYHTIVDFVDTNPRFSLMYSSDLSDRIYDQSETAAASMGFFGMSSEGESYRYGKCYIQIPPMATNKVYKYSPVYFDRLDYSISPTFSYDGANAMALYDIENGNYGLVELVDYEGAGGGNVLSGISGITSNGVRIMPNAQGIVELNGNNLYINKDTKKKNAS